MVFVKGRLVSLVAAGLVLTTACGSRPQLLSASKVEQAYRASGFVPIANIATKTPTNWLGDFYLGDPEPSAHVTIFKTEGAAKRAALSGVWRTVRRRNVVITFYFAGSRVQHARIERILVRLTS